jgi:hypothetical protein
MVQAMTPEMCRVFADQLTLKVPKGIQPLLNVIMVGEKSSEVPVDSMALPHRSVPL